MPQLAIAKSFLDRYSQLERRVRKAVDDALDRFATTHHAGGHLEKVTDARDPRVRTLRITVDYRGVVVAPEHGDTYLLVTVLPHDDAYTFGRNRRFSVNTALGVLEVRDETRLETVGTALAPAVEASPSRLFDGVTDKDLHQLGIDEQTRAIVRLLPDESYLDAIRPMMPAAQHDVLVALASGMTPEEAWAEVSKDLEEGTPGGVDPTDLEAAIRRSPDQAVFVDGPDSLREILDHPFDAWRTFLHPRQRRIAYRGSYSGPAMVTGGAGTGKTVTAVHRTAYLARRYAPADGSPILLTTFTTSLAGALRAQLGLLLTDPAHQDRVDVRNIDKIAVEVVRDARGAPVEARTERQLLPLWEEAAASSGVDGAFLFNEWEHVILAQDLRTERDYLRCRRHGRGTRLGAEQRRRVWQSTLAATRRMAEMGRWTFPQLAQEAAAILEREGRRPYRHVVVDEAQDLHPAKWRLTRALVPSTTDDLFVAGDPHQRIYDHRVSLAALGIDVRGRSRRLTVSYRSTQEILSWAVGVLGGNPAPGLDGLEDRLDGYSSLLRGQTPQVLEYPGRERELDALAERVAGWLGQGIEPHAIGVAGRTRTLVNQARDRLRAAGIDTDSLSGGSTGVRVGTMHGMKGLEFRCVSVVGVEAGQVPADSQVTPAAEDPVAHEHDLQRERNVLFVACTRARDALAVTYSGQPSVFLPR